MPLDEVKKGLESGELFEGNIRISQKCNSEAYVPSPVRIHLYNFILTFNFNHSIVIYRINLRIY